MSINFNDNFDVKTGKPIDRKYYNLLGDTYNSITEVNTDVILSYRYKGLTVNINDVEYWYATGTTNNDLIKKEFNNSFINLNDVSDADYVGKKGYISMVNEAEGGLELKNPYEYSRQGMYWEYSSGSTTGNPTNNKFIMDSLTPSSVTQINFSHVMDNINISSRLYNITSGDSIIMIQEDNHEKYIVLTATTNTVESGYNEIGVTIEDSNTIFDDGSTILTSLYYSEQEGGGTGGGHIIKENNIGLTQQPNLNFITSNSVTAISNTGTTTQIELTIDSLNDVDITSRQDANILSYNSTTGKHEYEQTKYDDSTQHSPEANINSSGITSTIIPSGYKIDTIIIQEDSGNDAGDISISSTSGYTNNIVDNVTVDANNVIDAPLGEQFFSLVNDQDMYISSSAWGSGIITVYFTFKKVI